MFTKIFLVLTLITPSNKPDVEQTIRMHSKEECIKAVMEWISQDIDAGGGVGYAAQCVIVKDTEGIDG